MELIELKKALDEQAAAWTLFKQENDKRLKLVEENKGGAGDFEEKLARMEKTINDAEEKEEKARKEVGVRIDGLEVAMKRPGKGDGEQKSAEVLEYEEKFDGYVRQGVDNGLMELEKKVLRTGAQSDGGYRVPSQMEAGILGRVRETSPVRTIAAVTSIGGGSWKEARVTGHTSLGGWVSEQGTRTATGTPTLGITEITPGEQYEMPPITQEALDDVDFGIEGWLTDEVAMSMSIRENTGFVLGDGVGKPRGFMTYVNGTDDTAGEIEQILSGAAGAVAADGLISVQEALLENFQPNAKWAMRRATRGIIRKLKNSTTNEYLLNRDFSQGGAATLLGKPVVLMADIAVPASLALYAAYGDFRQAYRVVDRIGIRVLRDPYTSKPLILFYTTKRVGGAVRNFQALKIGKCTTT